MASAGAADEQPREGKDQDAGYGGASRQKNMGYFLVDLTKGC